MADITFGVTVRVDKDYLTNAVNANGVTAAMTVAGLKSQTLTLSTSAAQIITSDLSSVGLCFLRNLSTATAATAQVGIFAGGSFASFATLRAGEPALLRLTPGVDYRATGSAGARLRVDITEG